MSLPFDDSTPRGEIAQRFNEVDGTYLVSQLGASQNIPNDTVTKVTGYSGYITNHSGGYAVYIGSGNWQIGVAGVYRAYANAGFVSNSGSWTQAGQRRIEIRKNGAIIWIDERNASPSSASYCSTTAIFEGAPGDLIAMHVKQNCGITLALDNDQCRLAIERAGQLWVP